MWKGVQVGAFKWVGVGRWVCGKVCRWMTVSRCVDRKGVQVCVWQGLWVGVCGLVWAGV